MSVKKAKTILDGHKQSAEACKGIKVPWHVWTKFHTSPVEVQFWGNQINLSPESGESPDFATLEELRDAVQWYVEQLGGQVVWPDEGGGVSKSSTVRSKKKA